MEVETDADKLLKYCLNLPLTKRDRLPYCSAIYVLYVSPNIILYIGKTISLQNRIKGHFSHLKRIADVSIAWFPLPVEFHTSIEKQLIQTYKPILNCNHVPSGSLHIHAGRTNQLNKFIRQQLGVETKVLRKR